MTSSQGKVTKEPSPLLDLLLSSEDEATARVNLVKLQDGGSQAQCATVEIQGVSAYGVIYSGADITIIGGLLFSTLDLAAGYCQIQMHPDAMEKTAFTTPQGLFEFRVMPFGLTNAPGVFQWLMQRVLARLNPHNGQAYVVVYIDDILVFSSSVAEHFQHPCCTCSRMYPSSRTEAKAHEVPVHQGGSRIFGSPDYTSRIEDE